MKREVCIKFGLNLRVLRKICGPKSDEETGKWRILHNEELCDLYCLTKFIGL